MRQRACQDVLGACNVLSKFALVVDASPDAEVHVDLNETSLRVRLPFFTALFAASAAVVVRVRVVLFTQGINEKQTLANATDAQAALIQARINALSFRNLLQYAKQVPGDHSKLLEALKVGH
jgi:predicted class III extradiol MEMO1 family dioxygenase